MKSRCLAALLSLTALACRSADKADDSADLIALQHGTLLNPGQPPVADATIVIQGGRIVCAGAAAECTLPAGAKTIDLTGAYVGPGLIDAHVHYSQTGWLDGRPDAANLRQQYPYDSVVRELEAHPEHFHRAALCSGVTSVFDVGGFRWTLDLAKKTRSSTDAPRVMAAGPLLSTIELPAEMMEVLVVMKDDSTVRAAVRDHQRRGAEAIKVWYVQVPDSLQKHARAMLMVAADETRKAGLRLLVHALEPERAREAVEAGPAVLVHDVFTGPMDQELLAAIKRSGAVVIPTLSVLDGYSDVFHGRSPARRYPLECVDSATRRKLETVVPDSLLDKASRAWWRGPAKALGPTASANLKRMYQAGIPLAMGTDAGNPGTAHGPGVYHEMESMQQAGIPAADVFASATIVAARAMALDKEIGSVEAGKRADLVVFDADPTADIRNARQVRLVVHNGKVHARQELLPRKRLRLRTHPSKSHSPDLSGKTLRMLSAAERATELGFLEATRYAQSPTDGTMLESAEHPHVGLEPCSPFRSQVHPQPRCNHEHLVDRAIHQVGEGESGPSSDIGAHPPPGELEMNLCVGNQCPGVGWGA